MTPPDYRRRAMIRGLARRRYPFAPGDPPSDPRSYAQRTDLTPYHRDLEAPTPAELVRQLGPSPLYDSGPRSEPQADSGAITPEEDPEC